MNSKFWLLQYQEIYFKYILEKMLKGKGFMSYHEYKAKKGIKISLNIFYLYFCHIILSTIKILKTFIT